MKFKSKVHNFGELRVSNKFLWFPKTINNETRWLERARYVERYSFGVGCPAGTASLDGWHPLYWCDESNTPVQVGDEVYHGDKHIMILAIDGDMCWCRHLGYDEPIHWQLKLGELSRNRQSKGELRV